MKKHERTVCVAVDMGASNIRIMAGILDKGQISYREIHRFTNEIRELEGSECWDIGAISSGIIAGVNKAITEFGDQIKSIGVDAWGVDFVLMGANGELVEQPVAYRDKRTEGMESLWNSLMSPRETFKRTGINFYIFNTLLQLLSYKESGLPDKTSHLLFIPSYIQYMLCGKIVNEQTISSTSQMLNVESGNWDERILSLVNIPGNIMGDLVPPGSILGTINNTEIDSDSIRAVAVCAHDTASAVAAIPAKDESFAFISTGTWCIVGMENDGPILSELALEEGFTNERGYDNTFRFLKNIIGLWLVQGSMNEMAEPTTYDKLESLATGSPGGYLVVPDDPSFYNPASMKQAFDDFFKKTGQQTPADMGSYFRCAYDSLIFSFRYHIQKMEQMTGKSVSSIHLIGGGCQSEYLSSQTARICGRTVISGPVEAATIGNILVQAIALKRIKGPAEARELVRESFDVKIYHPGQDTDHSDSEYSQFLKLRMKVLENS